jgi:hypothetical protein
MLKYLNLPNIQESLRTELIDHALDLFVPIDKKIMIDANPNPKVPLVDRNLFLIKDILLKSKLADLFLDKTYSFGLATFVNTESTPAMFPPHNDFRRTVAVNYILQAGGENVETFFYKDRPTDPMNSRFFAEDEIEFNQNLNV